MSTAITIEVCVDSAEGLAAAVAGGADRIELCSALPLGGLTPTPGLLALAKTCPVPVRAMIRPRAGDFRFGPDEQRSMLRDIDAVRGAGLAGIVIGALSRDGALDMDLLDRLVAHADGMAVTLHRVVDLLPDPVVAVAVAKQLGIATILTSGAASAAPGGADVIRAMRICAGDRVEIMAGAGVRPSNVAALICRTGIAAVHASCSVTITDADPVAQRFGFATGREARTDQETVAALREAAYAARPT